MSDHFPANHGFAFLSSGSYLKVPARASAPTKPAAVAGIAWDGCVTNRPGARFGPMAIRRASQMLCDGIHPHFDASPYELLCDAGDAVQGAITFDPIAYDERLGQGAAATSTDQDRRATAQAVYGLGGVSLLDVTSDGAIQGTPAPDCTTPTPTATATPPVTPSVSPTAELAETGAGDSLTIASSRAAVPALTHGRTTCSASASTLSAAAILP